MRSVAAVLLIFGAMACGRSTKAQNSDSTAMDSTSADSAVSTVLAASLEIDTTKLKNWSKVPESFKALGQFNGKQYFVPWDWGYASILYRTDMVDAADATGWELFWNEKYKGRISMWDGAQSNFEVAALKLGFPEMDNQTSDQVQQSKEALIEQKLAEPA